MSLRHKRIALVFGVVTGLIVLAVLGVLLFSIFYRCDRRQGPVASDFPEFPAFPSNSARHIDENEDHQLKIIKKYFPVSRSENNKKADNIYF